MSSTDENNTNYVAYRDLNALGQPRIGSLDLTTSLIQPLAFASGYPISSLYQVIEVGASEIKPSGDKIVLSKVQLLPPISGRDVLAVGKNYSEHAREFNSSGFDSSDKVDIPSHPVIFTKRATSIIASGESILPHPDFTQSADYEGEIGVIIGKAGFRIEEKDAMDYVWGYTIINDVTARERQRDHKQFFIGKSPDTFCPMGPIAVPASELPSVLRVQTSVNGEERQNATNEDLIFSVPFLIKTISEGQTILPGDIIATGTPAGVGIGKKPPVYLKPGDVIEVSITGLGTLKNSVSENTAKNQTLDRESQPSSIPISNLDKTCGGVGLTDINSKKLYYIQKGIPSGPPIIFIHGLGASSEYYNPLITTISLSEKYNLHLLDLEGHGLSPTSATSIISISSYTTDFAALAQKFSIKGATVIAHSMGCAVALKLATEHPEVVSKLVLLGPPTLPFPEDAGTFLIARAAVVRNSGMAAIVDAITTRAISTKTKSENLLAVAAIRMSLLGTDPEAYAKGCTALAGATDILSSQDIKAPTLIVTGDEDTICPPEAYEKLANEIQDAKVEVLKNVGHWHVFEDLKSVSEAVKTFL